jgi:hypothetical protein
VCASTESARFEHVPELQTIERAGISKLTTQTKQRAQPGIDRIRNPMRGNERAPDAVDATARARPGPASVRHRSAPMRRWLGEEMTSAQLTRRVRPRIDRNKLGTGRHARPFTRRTHGGTAPSLIVSRPNRRLDLIPRVTRQIVASLFGTYVAAATGRNATRFFFTVHHVTRFSLMLKK